MDGYLDFTGENTLYATHGMHSYAAKFPPQLVKYGLENYSQPGDIVLDPMVGSGTTVVESKILHRNAIGFDIDPLACLIARVKSRNLVDAKIEATYLLIKKKILRDINNLSNESTNKSLILRAKPPEFPNRDYWFSEKVQKELALISFHIQNSIDEVGLREFFWVAFSGIILTNVSVANARDITHSRHHYFSHQYPPNVLEKFERRVKRMRRQINELNSISKENKTKVKVIQGDARHLTTKENSIDFVFTSPPYVTALDYPRALFLAVSWMADILGVNHTEYKNNSVTYIGSERGRLGEFKFEKELGEVAHSTVSEIAGVDIRKAFLVQRYFQDMKQVFCEIGRVLKPQKYAIVVICPSHIRKIQVPTHKVFHELASNSKLDLVEEHTRTIDSNKRLLPYVRGKFGNRMTTEYVLIYRKRK